MPKTEHDLLGAGFEWRLRAALDRIEPRSSQPRYERAGAVRAWRVPPVALAAGITGVLVLTAYAASGSPATRDLEHRIVTAIQPNEEPSPTPPSSSAPAPRAAPVAPPSEKESPHGEPTRTAHPTERPEPSQPPRPAWPSPTPGDEGSSSPLPSPTPGDR